MELTNCRLMDNATRKAKESGEKRLQAKDIRKVTEVRFTACLIVMWKEDMC